MKFLSALCATLAGMLLIVCLLFTSLQLCMNDEGWFYNEYQELGTAERIGISTEDCTRAIMQLVRYMEGGEASIQLTVEENGRAVEMYNEREILHMVDVRALYQGFRTFRNVGLAGAAVLLAASALLKRRSFWREWGKGFIRGSVVMGLLLAALGIWVAVDFSSFWVKFHHLFFTNDLWLLDYATSRMIRICPEQLFYDIVVRFALLFLAPFAVLLAAAAVAKRAKGRKRRKGAGQNV